MIFFKNSIQHINQIVFDQIFFGIEVEKLRVTPDCRVSMLEFPEFDEKIEQFIDREFFTAQLEFKFPAQTSITKNIALINQIVRETENQIAPKERFWQLSTPPKLSDDLSELQITSGNDQMNSYRQTMAKTYDQRKILNCGVHVNISFSKPLLKLLKQQYNYRSSDEIYLQVAQYFAIHRWFLTYLFGATPHVDPSYGISQTKPVRSVRSGLDGFPQNIMGDFSSVENYVNHIKESIENGSILASTQFYDSVRLKSGKNKKIDDLMTNGITHLELRTFDQNPFMPGGVTAEQLRLIKVMALFFVSQPRLMPHELHEKQLIGAEINQLVCNENPLNQCLYQQTGLTLLSDLLNFSLKNKFGKTVYQTLEQYFTWFIDSKKTTAAKVLNHFFASVSQTNI